MRFHKGFQLDPRRLPSPDQAEQALASPSDHSQVMLVAQHIYSPIPEFIRLLGDMKHSRSAPSYLHVPPIGALTSSIRPMKQCAATHDRI